MQINIYESVIATLLHACNHLVLSRPFVTPALLNLKSHSDDSNDADGGNLQLSCATSTMASSLYQTNYEILGITQQAQLKEIREAYRKLALKCHPDKDPHNPRAVATFQKVSTNPIPAEAAVEAD